MPKNLIKRAIVTEGFPAPIRLGERSKGWWLHEVEEWLANRPRGITPCSDIPQYARQRGEDA